MSRLLYHAPDKPDQESPFDRAIVQIISDQDVRIVSPYISLEYLQRLIHMSQSWRLVSDVLEWLSATPRRERDLVYEFLAKHDGLIHHYPAIHAKTVLSGVGVYTGSANLTHSGVLRRTEFGVLLTDQVQVQETHDWFDAIWRQTSPPPLNSVLELIAELNSISNQALLNTLDRPAQIDSTARRVRARLVNVLGYKPISLQVRQQNKEVKATRVSRPLVSDLPQAAKLADSIELMRDNRASVVEDAVFPLTHILVPVIPSEILTVESSLATPSPAPVVPRMREVPAFDIESEIQVFVERHADAGFTFIQAHNFMRSLAHGLPMRDTYLALLEWCASHPRSLFSEDAVHRLVYSNGHFIQSKEADLHRVLEPMDHLVARILNALSFGEATQSLSDEVRDSTPIAVFEKVVASMIGAGFILCTAEGLRLIPVKIWSQRLKLLKRAHNCWSARLAAHELSLAKQNALKMQAAKKAAIKDNPARETLLAESVTTTSGKEESDALSDARVERQAQFDQVFAHLAWLYVNRGEIIESSMDKLLADLMDASKLSLSEVKRLVSGTYTLLRSPFAVMQTGSKKRLRIYHDLLDNTHLGDYPSTRQIISKSPSLKELTHPPRPIDLPQPDVSAKIQMAASRVKSLTLAQADDAYVLICKCIFEQLEAKKSPKSRKDLLRLFSKIGVDTDVVNKLLFASRETRFNLFAINHHGVDSLTLRLHHHKLDVFPNTKRYLEEQVWTNLVSHHWLPSLEVFTLEILKGREMSMLRHLKNKAKERDKIYARILKRIVNSIPPNSRFISHNDLIISLKKDGEQQLAISYLLGMVHPPKSPLLTFRKDEIGYYLHLEPDVLPLYKACMKIIQQMAAGEIMNHSWLLNLKNAARIQKITSISKSLEQPITKNLPDKAKEKSVPLTRFNSDLSFSMPKIPALEIIPQKTLSPLVWKDKTYHQLDTLYTSLAGHFAKHGNPLKRSVTGDGGELVLTRVLENYEVINNLRKNSQDVIQPVLSLRMAGESYADIELVIYGSYQYHRDKFPKLQRLLHFSDLRIREV